MNPILTTILEILGGGVALGVIIKLRQSGCLIKKKPNSCDCSVQADLDGDGKTDLKISVSDVDSPSSDDCFAEDKKLEHLDRSESKV